MEEDAPFVVQINCWDEEREKLHFIGELGLVDGMADALVVPPVTAQVKNIYDQNNGLDKVEDSTILVKTFDQWGQDMDDENNIHEFGGEQCGVEEGGQVQQGLDADKIGLVEYSISCIAPGR